ncbi:MAG: PAS domain S-box protein [Bacteroidota bacterium]
MITRIDQLNELSGLESDLAFWIFSKSKKSFEYISPRVEKIFEANIDKISDIRDFRRVVHPRDQMKVIRNLNGGGYNSANEIDYRVITPSGDIKWLKNISIGIENKHNEVNTVIGCTYVKPITTGFKKIENYINDKLLLRSLPDSFIIATSSGKILNENIGVAEQPVLKNNIGSNTEKELSTVLNATLSTQIKTKISEYGEQKKNVSFECEINLQDESEWFEVRITKIQPDIFLIMLRNITDTLNRINKIEKFFDIAEQSQELIMITNVEGIIEYVNPMISKISGYGYNELIGQKPNIFKSDKHDDLFYKELWENVLQGKSFKAQFHNRKRNGDYFIEEKIITPFSNVKGEITNFISTGRDVTQERKNEKKANKYKQLEDTIYEKEQKTRTLSLIKSNEIERKKFAEEIHEGLSQMLSVAMVNLDNLLVKQVISFEEKNKIEFIYQMVSEIIQELRGISTNLSPISLYEFGLYPIVKQMAKTTNAKNKEIKVLFASNIEGIRFKNEIEINLYRIIQEALANAIKHSNATKISLVITYNHSILTLIIDDNGGGINLNVLEFKKMNTHGILNIEARAKSIGGTLNITTQKGKGFKIELIINTKKSSI